jgi:hypothetical protein
MKMGPESPNCRESNGYVKQQLRERHRDLEALEVERGLIDVTSSDYLSSRRSLLQAISELETLLWTARNRAPEIK